MSAVLDAGVVPAATEPLQTTFEVNRAWEVDRALMLEKSERRGWMVGAVGIVLAVLSVLAVFGCLAPRIIRCSASARLWCSSAWSCLP